MSYKSILVWIGRLAGVACFVLSAMMFDDASNAALMASPDQSPDRQMMFVFFAMTMIGIGLVLLLVSEVLDAVLKARNG